MKSAPVIISAREPVMGETEGGRRPNSGIGFMTPEQVHCGIVPRIIETRSKAMIKAFLANPIRWNGRHHPKLPKIRAPRSGLDQPSNKDKNATLILWPWVSYFH